LNISSTKAKEIAVRFLQQYHSVVLTSADLKGDVWIITAKVGFAPNQIRRIQVDVETGKIMGYA